MTSKFKEQLMEASAGISSCSSSGRSFKRSIVASPRYFTRRSLTTPDGSSQHQQWESTNNTSNGSPELRRRFLFRLAVALHTYGSSASRTEYLIERAADRLHIETNIAVFPTLILLSFTNADDTSEIHLITVESELDVGKLGRADELANNVGKQEAPLVLSYWRLKAIATSPPEFDTFWRLFSFALSASMAALLFFDGNLWDAVFSFLLGLIVGILDLFSTKSSLFAAVTKFIASVIVSFFARILSTYLKHFKLCFSSIALSALVELLPGMSLTLGVSEMVGKAHVTGTSRVMYALFSALQLGFGLAIGDSFMWWKSKPSAAEESCIQPSYPIWWNILWFSGYTIASNILLNARLSQWPGMALAAGVGYFVSEATGKLSSSASTVLAAFAVGVTGSSYSYVTGDLPLVMVLSGILVLVPGGLGVEGIAEMFGKDISAGMGFVFDMIEVALSITIGLLIAKNIHPHGLFGTSKKVAHNKSTLAAQLEDDASDVEKEEDMAI